MSTRHLLGSFPSDGDDWAAPPPLPGHGLDGAVLPRLEGAAAEAAPSSEEAALVARARRGDQEAFGALVRSHQRQVFALAQRMLRNVDEASEATQEVFLQAWQGLRGFRGDARFTTWLYRITYNYCLKVSQSRQRDSAARAALIEASARAHSEASLVSAHYARAAEQDLCQLVRDEMAHLPPKYRAVLALRHLYDYSYEEMAEIMSVPIGTVKAQLFRARAQLKERLECLSRGGTEGLTGLTGGLTEGIAQRIARAGEIRAELGASLRHMIERSTRERPTRERSMRESPYKGDGQ